MAQAFFGCPVFYNFERILLKLVYSVPDPNLNNKQFNTGEVVYLWKVVAKTDTEILLRWEASGLQGLTW